MDPTKPPSGRLQIINGTLFYSPNDYRTLASVPDEDPTGVETARVFLPTRSDVAASSFTRRMEEVHAPRWWSLAWGWTAFIPIKPRYERFLQLLARDPSPHNYRKKHGRFSVGTPSLQQYCNLEQDLYHITHLLSMQLQISVVKPSHPTVFGFRSEHGTHAELVDSARASRDWFDVWVGMLCYLISETEEEQIKKRGFPVLAILQWMEALVKQGQSRATVQELNAEAVCSFEPDIRRVGTFLRLDNPKLHRPEAFVRRLERLHVPVWYRWLPEYEHHAFFSNLGPASSQIQDLLVVTIPEPLDLITIGPQRRSSPVLDSIKPTITPQAVLDFFTAREQEHLRLEAMETAPQRMARLQRMARPPIASAIVWVWEETPDSGWVRERVGQRYRVSTLDEMQPYQKRYDPYFNEWNCCDLLPRPQGYDSEFSGDEDGSGSDDHDHEAVGYEHFEYSSDPDSLVQQQVGISTGSREEATNSVDAEGVRLQPSSEQERFSLPVEDMDDLAAIQNGSSAALATEVDTAEEYILQVLRLYYGFTPPFPLPDSAGQQIHERVQNRFLKFVGIPLHRVHRDLFLRASILCAVSFIEKLGTGQQISDDDTDLSPDNRVSLRFNDRLRVVQAISDAKTGKTLYMFNFGIRSTVPWHITVRSAKHALAICRLGAHLDDRDIALYLVQHGIPFNTLQKSSTLPRMPIMSKSSRLVAYRMQGHIFDEDDYAAYLMSVENSLRDCRMGRAALLGGGYPWRLATTMLNLNLVLDGPTGWSTSQEDIFVVIDKESGEEYIDDGMSELESELLCGLFECFTGNGAQTSRKSYYPLSSTFKGSGVDYGRWTVLLENAFKTAREGSATGSRQPKTMTQWRDVTRGAGDFRRAQSRIEELSRAFIRDYSSQRSGIMD